MMTLSEELKWRGFVNQSTIEDLTELDKKKWTFYHGYDASADSQTIGNLAAMMFDKVFMRHGNKAVILVGGATSLIGDPGGKDVERPLQDEQMVAHNIGQAEKQIKKVLGNDISGMVNNLDWTKNLTVIEFLRDVGKHFSMTPLVQRDYIAQRMGKDGSGISYTEFSYTLLQGYDYLHLHQKYGVDLQLAGSDQWGNSLSGVELVRKVSGDTVHALTMPLVIDKATGRKFGKSEEGAVWLDAKKTSPNDFYQFWVNASDDNAGDYLKIFTELGKDEIAKVMKEFEDNKPQRLAQKTLAYEVTKLVHGKTAADDAKDHADTLGRSNVTDSAASTASVAVGDSIVDTLVKCGLANSKTEARQLLEAGGVYINNRKADKTNFEAVDFKDNRLILRRGKTLRNTVVLRQR